jgi:hypothetical protein
VGGRFPLYTDADVDGHVIEALVHAGWDGERAVVNRPKGSTLSVGSFSTYT